MKRGVCEVKQAGDDFTGVWILDLFLHKKKYKLKKLTGGSRALIIQTLYSN
jgi:hypothetical protein